MMKWSVALAGQRFDLEELPRSFNSADVKIREDAGIHYLESARFEDLASADEVRQAAEKLITAVNGLGRLLIGDFHPVGSSQVIRHEEGGERTISVCVTESIAVREKIGAALAEPDGSASPLTRPIQEPIEEWLRLVAKDKHVTDVLRLLAKHPTPWSDLYKMLEIVQHDAKPGIVQSGWASKAEVDRFSATVNSAEAIGEHARHAPKPGRSRLLVLWTTDRRMPWCAESSGPGPPLTAGGKHEWWFLAGVPRGAVARRLARAFPLRRLRRPFGPTSARGWRRLRGVGNAWNVRRHSSWRPSTVGLLGQGT